MPLKKISKKIKQNGFIKSVSILVGGTAFAQALMVIALPILTRIYTPEDFNLLAVYSALLAIFSVAACLRLDIAIPIPDRDTESINLLALALFFSTIISLSLFIPTLLFPELISENLNNSSIKSYLWLLPIGVFFSSSYSALQFWAARKKAFSEIAKTRVTQATGGVAAQLSLGWAGFTPAGLVIGQIISSGAGIYRLAKLILMEKDSPIRSISSQEMRNQFKKHERFPKYSTLESLSNSAGIQLPLIMIAALAAGPEAGFLMLAMRVMQAPMALIGNAVSQVYYSHAAERHRDGSLNEFTSATLVRLMQVGTGPLIFAGLVAPDAFDIAFGDDWRRAGELVSWMTPWFIMQFLASPISMIMHILNHQRAMLLLTIGGLLIRTGSITIAARLTPNLLSEFYSISGLIFYSICFFIFSTHAGLNAKSHFEIIKSSIPYIAAWMGIALLARIAIYLFH